VVSLGGDLTSPAADDEQPGAAADIDRQPPAAAAAPEPANPALAAAGSSAPEDPQYDHARAVLGTVDPADLGELLANAQGEIELELAEQAGAQDDGLVQRADHRQIMIRAAAIVARAERGGA
jgi:hypothetical protein